MYKTSISRKSSKTQTAQQELLEIERKKAEMLREVIELEKKKRMLGSIERSVNVIESSSSENKDVDLAFLETLLTDIKKIPARLKLKFRSKLIDLVNSFPAEDDSAVDNITSE